MKAFKLTMMAAMLAFASSAMAQKVVALTVDDIQVANGEEAELVVKMDYETTETVVGLNFSLYLPDGILLKGFDTKEAQDAAKASALKKEKDAAVVLAENEKEKKEKALAERDAAFAEAEELRNQLAALKKQ